jgi:hypothetical protein
MIIVTEIGQLIEWLQQNRNDKESGKPYFIPIEVEGSYSIDEDSLIMRGINDLNIPYSKIYDFNGVSFTVDSELFNE